MQLLISLDLLINSLLFPFYPPESLNADGLPCGDASISLYSGLQRKPLVCPVDSLASTLQEQLSYNRDPDSLTTSPSSSSVDTCSSQKTFQTLSKSSGSPIHQETNIAGEVREPGEGSSFSETEGCSEEPKIARSVTDGALRHPVLNPLSHHGVSTQAHLNKDCSLDCLVTNPFTSIVSEFAPLVPLFKRLNEATTNCTFKLAF